jgi:ureidoglycolate hydrolase
MENGVPRVRPEPLSEGAWAPFGWFPMADTDPRDGQHRLEFAWDDVHVNIIGHTLEELVQVPGALRCQAMYRHDTHTQTLMSLDERAVIAVAPASAAMAGKDDLRFVRAFVLEPLQPFVLHRGTWHWGPYPLGAPEVRLFNVQGLRYSEDNRCADLASLGSSFDVETEGADTGIKLTTPAPRESASEVARAQP